MQRGQNETGPVWSRPHRQRGRESVCHWWDSFLREVNFQLTHVPSTFSKMLGILIHIHEYPGVSTHLYAQTLPCVHTGQCYS